MSVRPLRLIGDPVLRSTCEPVTTFDEALAALVEDLLDTVQVPGRAGLAANQIGVALAAFSYLVEGRLGSGRVPRVRLALFEPRSSRAALSARPGTSSTTARTSALPGTIWISKPIDPDPRDAA